MVYNIIKLHVFFSLEMFQCCVDDNSESCSKQIGGQTCVKGQTQRNRHRHVQAYTAL